MLSMNGVYWEIRIKTFQSDGAVVYKLISLENH